MTFRKNINRSFFYTKIYVYVCWTDNLCFQIETFALKKIYTLSITSNHYKHGLYFLLRLFVRNLSYVRFSVNIFVIKYWSVHRKIRYARGTVICKIWKCRDMQKKLLKNLINYIVMWYNEPALNRHDRPK